VRCDVVERRLDDRLVPRPLDGALEPDPLGLEDEVLGGLGLRGRGIDALRRQAVVELVAVDAQLDGQQQRDAERAAELLARVDHPRGLALVVLVHRGQASRVVDGEDDAEPQPLQD
jgi:hypothetical protein